MLQPDPAHLLEQMRAARENPAFCTSARLTASEWIRSRFSWKNATARLLEVLFPEAQFEAGETRSAVAD
jgi:hypothetical protein